MSTYAESKTPHPQINMPSSYGVAKFKLKTWTTTTVASGSSHWSKIEVEYCGEIYGTFLKQSEAYPVDVGSLQTDRYTFTAPVTATDGKFTTATNTLTTSSTTSASPEYVLPPGAGILLMPQEEMTHTIRLKIDLLNLKMVPADGDSQTVKVTGDVRARCEAYSEDYGAWFEVGGSTDLKAIEIIVPSHKH